MSQKHGVQTPNYKTIRIFLSWNSIPYERSKKSRGRGVLIFIMRIFLAKFERTFLNLRNIKKTLFLEISNKFKISRERVIINCYYKPPKGATDLLSTFLKLNSTQCSANSLYETFLNIFNKI